MAAQPRAAAASQVDLPLPTRQETLVDDTDLLTSEDDVPPPAYGAIHGEIRNENNGLGTSARVTDDGRVNIRINQLDRRLSQIFTPALRQKVKSGEDSRPPPLPYIPPSLGGEVGVPPPPPLNVVIQVVGSRGDVQPFIALGEVLKNTYGHRVRLATHPNFKDFVEENGLEFFSIGGDPSQLMAFMVKNPGLTPSFSSILSGDVRDRRKDVAEYIQGCWRSCYQVGDGMDLSATDEDLSKTGARPFVADCIIANPPSFAHIHCAEKLGIPLHIMFTMPYSPTQAFPHPLANIQSSNADPQLTNYISYAMIELLTWQGLADIINKFRVKCLDLEPVSQIWAPGMLQRLNVPHTYCWSPALVPKPKDWGPHISIAGFYFLNLATNYTPAPDLKAFLDAGPPPVYIGFGSIVLDNPDAMTELIFEAVRKTGQRVLLSKGWGGVGGDELSTPPGVFILGNVPHDWLFKHVSCVVHHGGAGTTAAGITAGRPTLVVPFFGDQPFWGAMVARAGAGPDPVPHKQLTADKLTDAINFCLRPETLERAKELASNIAAERGSDVGAQSFHQYLEPDRLRCALIPSRSAAWRIKRTQIRLSPFAACTLANAKLLDFNNLKLFRPQEFETDQGPSDPISGGFVALCGVFSSMTMGLAEVPTETWKALQLTSSNSRQKSRASVPTIARESEASDKQAKETPTISPQQSQTSLDVQESNARVQSPPNPSGPSSPSLESGSSSISIASQGQSSSNQDETSRSQVRSKNASGSGKDYDMMRQTGVHMGKGMGRLTQALVEAPMEVSLSTTKGLHNLPKLWGDDTVRRQAPVTNFKSGAKAAGTQFGLGMYDGITGLVTQPWKGAQKEGTAGFFKGLGKGIGGFATKPGAAMLGVPSYMMKGVQKEVQKSFGSKVQHYIIAARAAQGYEEWLQSSDAEKQDIIVRWKSIQEDVKDVKKGRNRGEKKRDALGAQRKTKTKDGETRENLGRTTSSAQPASADASSLDPESALLATGSFHIPRKPLGATAINESSPKEQIQTSSDSELESDVGLDDEEDEEFERAERRSEKMPAEAAAVRGGSLDVQPPPSYDPGHLEGTTQTQFEAQQQGKVGGKTTQERTEEEIVMEYVKKQSVQEAQHRNNGKSHATGIEDEEDEDLQKALKLSMQK